MKFRPCIDIHNGKVKQIVGGSLRDEGNQAKYEFYFRTGCGMVCRTLSEGQIERRAYHPVKPGRVGIL